MCYSHKEIKKVTCSEDTSNDKHIEKQIEIPELIGVHYAGWCNVTNPAVENWISPGIQYLLNINRNYLKSVS